MTINDKIKQILIEKNLSPSYFADEIGVQRSSISHILSGRNRPSFDIIQKIIRRFPELGYEWIMEDESQNPMPSQASSINYSTRNTIRPNDRPDRFHQEVSYSVPQPLGVRSQRNEIPPSSPTVPINSEFVEEPAPMPTTAEKKVERILIFYTDGSFREYTSTH
ncbi:MULTISPECIES: helix-turn-helix transcriptional regulator [Spirosoma]|uniref:Helix-turn-helix domain-containing protein n=1 Tax=Spirosoma liriopis TaxID=2937440 RepID=A0ABT0HPG1_9BACT|nr:MULTISPECIES: helix-turn-helix transcriptional regulator [Spirosoma]MCK8494068.1 helix-turn-helix domain-containing protein [Spirosoma liriopis]UHG89084.1 helix-turn-helix domain-containing protein [Spirosoma oryzicola]